MKMVLKIAKLLTFRSYKRKTELFDLFLFFFIIMVTRLCAHHVEKIRKVYRRIISLEDAHGKMVLK